MLRLSRDTYLPVSMGHDAYARLAAVLLTAPPGTVASHRTAAALWDVEIPLENRDDRRVDLTLPAAGRAESWRDRRIHRIPLGDEEVVRRGSMPVRRALPAGSDGPWGPGASPAIWDRAG